MIIKMAEKIKVYHYKCPYCKEWTFYKPRKEPKQQNLFNTGYLYGPYTHHCGFKIDVGKVEHNPPFPWEDV